jgi:hypothetical protein
VEVLKMKKVFLAFAGCVFAALVGCNGAVSPDYQGEDHPAFKQEVANPGILHNDIARAFAARLASQYGDQPLTRKQFVALMVSASNDAFRTEGLVPDVTAADINVGVNEIMNLRNRKVFDFFSYRPGDPEAILNDWEQRGIVSHTDARGIRARLKDPGAVYSGSRSKTLNGFDSVCLASVELWTSPDFNVTRRGGPQMDEPPPNKESLRFQMDSIFYLLGVGLTKSGTGGSVIGALASLAFEMCPPADPGGWDCSDYCNMG